MDFSEKQIISHAIIRGLCNRAEGGREGGDKEGRWSLMGGERASIAVGLRASMYQRPQAMHPVRKKVLWCPGLTAERMPMSHKTWWHLSSAASWRALDMGRTSGCCKATLCVGRISCRQACLAWDVGWGGYVLSQPHVRSSADVGGHQG